MTSPAPGRGDRPRLASRAASLGALLSLLTLILTGCFVLPIPATGKKVVEGTSIHTNDLNFIVAGKTTRWELMQRVGVPSEFFDRMKVAAYTWETASLYLAYGLVGPSGGGGDVETFTKNHTLLVQFDSHDRVTRYELTRKRRSESLESLAAKWSLSSAPTKSVSLQDVLPSAPPGESVLVVYRTGRSMEAWKLKPRILVDGQDAADFQRHDHVWMVLPAGSFSVLVEFEQPHGVNSADSKFQSRIVFFDLNPGRTHYVRVNLREDAAPPWVDLESGCEPDTLLLAR